jgi:outer membrane protein assembly factor BamD (BamD/ComL family)
MAKHRSTSLAALLSIAVLASSARAQDDGFQFDIVEEAAQDTDSAKLDAARQALNDERFPEALAGFESVLSDAKMKRYHPQAEYSIAKTLVRMGATHSALARYQLILDAGPKHPHYQQAQQWLFFISKSMRDELKPLSMVSTYAKTEDIPADQQSDLSYALARYYFLTALNLGAEGAEVKESVIVDEPADDKAPLPPTPENDPKPDDKPADGFEFNPEDLGGGDDDGFGFGDADVTDAPKKEKKKKAEKVKKEDKKKEEKKKDEIAPPLDVSPAEEPKPVPKAKGANTSEAALTSALNAVNRVKDTFPVFGQAVYLKGLIHFARGELEDAVKQFRSVVRMTNPRGGTVQNAKLREIHYQSEQFRYAIFYYDRVSRDSTQWLDAVFESSWSHFRLAQYEKALGNLVTLQSPFFVDEYYPESSILKAITFYENCRYPEARAFLGEFKQNYGGIAAELERLVGTDPNAPAKTADELFSELTAFEEKVNQGKDDAARTIALTARLVRLALSDKRIASSKDAIAEVDEEKALLGAQGVPFGGSPLHGKLLADLDVRRGELVNLAGTLLRAKLESERQNLSDLTQKLVRIQFEIAKMEKNDLEATLSDQNQTVALSGYNFTTATDDERTFWPFEGEYWRDELGTYQYTLTKGCKPPSETTISGN